MNLEVSFCVSCKVASGISYKLYIYIYNYIHIIQLVSIIMTGWEIHPSPDKKLDG